MNIRLVVIASLGAAIAAAAASAQTADDPDQSCARWPKGTTQTLAGMCIDGVLFKAVLARLAELERRLASPTIPQGKPVR